MSIFQQSLFLQSIHKINKIHSIYIRVKEKKKNRNRSFFNSFPEKFQKHLKFTENYLKSQNSKKGTNYIRNYLFLERQREKKILKTFHNPSQQYVESPI